MADLTPQTPQFEKAQYLGEPGANPCAFCKQTVTHQYYRVNGATACPACTLEAQRYSPSDTHAAFVRSLLFGAGGAILGLVLYAGVEMATGWIIGYVALAVGFIVAKAMQMGSGGAGGRRYQIAAVLLTYASVSLAAIPVAIHQRSESAPQHQTAPAPTTNNSDSASPDQSQTITAEKEAQPEKPPMGFFKAIGYLLVLGLASPFLDLADPFHGAIGLVILFVGIRIAWRMMAARSAQIFGPFETPPAA